MSAQDDGHVTIPTKEAIEHGRRAIGALRDKARRWQAEAEAAGDDDKARRNKWLAFMLEHDLLGSDEGGCVITAFDLRWLDDGFRSMMEEVRNGL